jgi:hypothetical protein
VLGLPVAGLALFASLLGCLLDHQRQPNACDSLAHTLLLHAGAAAALLGMTAVAWVLPMQKSLSTTDFIHIVAEYRHPHHYLFSHFPPTYFVNLACLIAALIAAMVIYARIAGPVNRSITTIQLAAITACVVVLMVLGYVFVEVIPTRFITTLQTERLAQLLHWVTFLLLGLLAAEAVERRRDIGGWTIAALLVVGCFAGGRGTLIAVGYGLVLHVGLIATDRQSTRRTFLLFAAAGIVAVLASMVPLELLPRLLGTLALTAYWIVVVSRLRSSAWQLAFPAAVALAMAGLYVVGQRPGTPYILFATAPKFFLDDRLPNDPFRDNFEYARAHTPENAVFIVPPAGGRMRIVGRRAVAADFKAFPFQDEAIREWYMRSRRFYGEKVATEDARNDFYDALGDERLIALAKHHDADYAVLTNETPTNLAEVFRGRSHKIVAFADP